jgi:hypothetical protein
VAEWLRAFKLPSNFVYRSAVVQKTEDKPTNPRKAFGGVVHKGDPRHRP